MSDISEVNPQSVFHVDSRRVARLGVDAERRYNSLPSEMNFVPFDRSLSDLLSRANNSRINLNAAEIFAVFKPACAKVSIFVYVVTPDRSALHALLSRNFHCGERRKR